MFTHELISCGIQNKSIKRKNKDDSKDLVSVMLTSHDATIDSNCSYILTRIDPMLIHSSTLISCLPLYVLPVISIPTSVVVNSIDKIEELVMGPRSQASQIEVACCYSMFPFLIVTLINL